MQGLMKTIPGEPADRPRPIWMEPDPYYGPKDQSQDITGREMEKKYTGRNLSRFDGPALRRAEKEEKAKLEQAMKDDPQLKEVVDAFKDLTSRKQ